MTITQERPAATSSTMKHFISIAQTSHDELRHTLDVAKRLRFDAIRLFRGVERLQILVVQLMRFTDSELAETLDREIDGYVVLEMTVEREQRQRSGLVVMHGGELEIRHRGYRVVRLVGSARVEIIGRIRR